MNGQSKHCYAVLMKALQEDDLTYKQMADISGFTIWWVIRYVQELAKKKQVYVCGYQRDALGRETIKVFRYGKGPNATPSKLTGAEKQRRYKARKRLPPTSLLAGGQAWA